MNKIYIVAGLIIFLSFIAGGCADTPAPSQSRASSNAPQGQAAFQNSSCYQAGFQWGVCAAKETAGQKCQAGVDAAVPESCKNRPETQQGIKDGVRSIQMQQYRMQ